MDAERFSGELGAFRDDLTGQLARIEQQLDERLSLLCDELRTANLLAYLAFLRDGDGGTDVTRAQAERIDKEIQRRLALPG